jgi:hypothetical protein
LIKKSISHHWACVFVNIAKKYVYTDFVKKNRWKINLIHKTMEIIIRLF